MMNINGLLDELTDEQIENIKQKYLTEEIKSFINKEEYLQTINAFFECGLNVSEAAKKAFMHRNTLTYRLDKFERVTKLSLHSIENAFLVKLLIAINQYKRV